MVALTSEARRDILLRGLGSSRLSICSFCRNSGGSRMSMGSERRLLTSCREHREGTEHREVTAGLDSVTEPSRDRRMRSGGTWGRKGGCHSLCVTL